MGFQSGHMQSQVPTRHPIWGRLVGRFCGRVQCDRDDPAAIIRGAVLVLVSGEPGGDVAYQPDDSPRVLTLRVLLGVIDGQTPAQTAAGADSGSEQFGQLPPGQSAGLILNTGQTLRGKPDWVEHIEVDMQPPAPGTAGYVTDRFPRGGRRVRSHVTG